MKILSLISLIVLLKITECARILGIFPTSGRSHYILGSSLMKGLAEKGHDVTVISPYPEKDPPKNGSYVDITLTSFAKPQDKNNNSLFSVSDSFNLFQLNDINFLVYLLAMNSIGNEFTEGTLSDPNVQKLLKSDKKFDVVIIEQFVNDGLKVFAHHFQAHLVVFVTFGSNAWINPLVANPAPPSYVPEQKINMDPKNFFHRVFNTIIYIAGELNRNLLFFPAQNKIMKKYFPDAPDLDVLNYNASLVLVNSHISTNKPVPRVPSMVDIGGFHINPPKKLPKDLQEYLDSAKEGVVYFSMGSTLQSINLPVEKREAILRVFSKLKQKVLWKWEDESLPGQPQNVKLGKWLPQQDILAHPNVKAFVTHGGLLSILESVYHGVPVLALPVFGDQVMNAAEAAWNGCGRYILYDDLNEETLEEALNDILKNPKYSENMKTRSKLMRDRQNKPIDVADYWIRHIIRHNGGAHLRVAGLELPWYQYLVLDVVAFLIAITLLTIYLIYAFIKIILKTLSKNKNKSKIKKN
ncbi:hypothetical protein MTP99_017082 [Tenebrio molitor]|nr:hypothetical protein MTP99_017082 [Tenebrio molitor]CAH1375671.1 unnamed protein product [Tenebrio molitor]